MGRYTGKRCRLISMLILTSLFFFIEIVVGYLTNSMALVADSFHMLSDVISLIIAFISVRISPMKWSQNTFGWARAEILGALVNAVFLIALCFSILVEAIKRFFTPEEITQPALILYVGAAGLVVNLIGLGLFRGSKKVVTSEMSLNSQQDINENQIVPPVPNKEKKVKKPHSSSQMNMRGVFLHVLTDALGSVIVLVSALIIWKTDWAFKLYVDPTLSQVLRQVPSPIVPGLETKKKPMRQWMSPESRVAESSMILLQTVPTHIEVEALKRKLLLNLAGEKIIASAHICCRDMADYMALASRIKEFFHNEGIHSTTIQPEFIGPLPNSHGSKCADAFRMLTVAYGEATLDRSNVYRWYKMFSEGREDVNDEERAGRPSTSTTDEKINEVEKMILANRRITVREVAEDLNISIGSCHSIFINDLGMRRVAAKFVPKLLNCDQKQHRMNIANEMLDYVRDDPNLLQRVITGDEAWVYGYDVETKAQSSQWKLPHEPRPKKARQVRSNVKVLLTVFFDCRGVVHHEFLPQGRTVNKEYYLQVMRNLCEAIRQKRPDLWKNKNWLLHHDNDPAHTSLLLRDFLAKNNTLMMPQPPYSPDLAPCDFFLFPKLKRPMKGRRYATLDEIKTASQEELKKILKNDFLKCFEDWKNRWHKCIISHGNYFEGDKIGIHE
ncbi:hypothetical protein LAZ67_16000864 [Cordylochernes scorpioides]|uniref:Cation efflux protein transmembrane domain-containing protein n=1 Tax=Cordylochernes scorpioides TaxID=51811 RepID=A0ABY6LF13_9ARAC|nr:hypothetical protein LAZ67_16000864 [Cordylochernes scorpioides]